MKTTKYLSLAALALMGTLASCQSDDEAAVSFARPANAVGINVTVGSLLTTRSNPASADFDEAHYFNLGDQVSVSTDGQDPVIFQCQDADQQTWAEAEAGKFLLWKQSEMTFQAYYPATEGTSMTAFTLPADQSTEAKIALADYMTRQQTCTNESSTDINLTLERKTARVIVRIAGFTDQYDNDQKTVSNVRINSQFSAIADDNGTGDVTAVTPYQDGTGGLNTTYTALVVPGSGDDGADFITLTDALNNTLKVKGIPELEAGNSYTFNLTVGKNTIQVQSVTVQDWTTGTTLAGGQAQEQGGATGHDPTCPLLSAATTADCGKVVCAAGYLHDAKTAVPAGCTAVGILGKVTETGHGLILALQNATSQNWNTINGWTSETNYAGTTLKLLPDDAARGTNLTSYTTLGETTVSNWAVAQKSDYEAIFTNLGSTTDNNGNGKTYDDNVNAYITTGVGGTAISGFCWSATERDGNIAWRFISGFWDDFSKMSSNSVRPVLGFTTAAPAPAAPFAVDLGLPSGIKWANMNVGASSEGDYGLFFAWGETTGYGSDTSDGHNFGWANYSLCNGSKSTLTKYNNEADFGTVDNKTTLEAADDAATANWGSNWRMPTKAELDELLATKENVNYTWEWTTVDGHNGYRITNTTTGANIFLPASGTRSGVTLSTQDSYGGYWSSSLSEYTPANSHCLGFGSSNASMSFSYRPGGQSVRAVQNN